VGGTHPIYKKISSTWSCVPGCLNLATLFPYNPTLMKGNKMIDETNKPTTTLLEDLEDLVGQLQRDKLTEKQAVEILSNIVKYEKEESK